jgi:hypothetical protein
MCSVQVIERTIPVAKAKAAPLLDDLSTHKPKRDPWLARHPSVHFH